MYSAPSQHNAPHLTRIEQTICLSVTTNHVPKIIVVRMIIFCPKKCTICCHYEHLNNFVRLTNRKACMLIVYQYWLFFVVKLCTGEKANVWLMCVLAMGKVGQPWWLKYISGKEFYSAYSLSWCDILFRELCYFGWKSTFSINLFKV